MAWNSTKSADFYALHNSYLSKIIAVTGFFITISFGIPLWIALIHFEKNGGDPQKRSISNILTSYLGYVVVCATIICAPIKLARVLFGCLPLRISEIFVVTRHFGSYMVGSIFPFLLMYRCLRLYKFQLTAWFIDDFLGPFLLVTLIMLNTVLICIKYHLGLMENITLKALSCVDMKVVEFKDDL